MRHQATNTRHQGTALQSATREALRLPGMPDETAKLVVGLSGGADSVALLHSLSSVRSGELIAAHLDHGLRPESREDVAFCRELCRHLAIAFVSARVDVGEIARTRGAGLEETARVERYRFLRAILDEHHGGAIAVAHTRDDRAETLLMNLLRGAGSDGLGSMPQVQGDVIRPLLRASREDVLDHLARHELPHREDATNSDLRFTRNRIRHALIPSLEAAFNPRAREALAGAADLLADEAEALDALADELLDSAGVRSEGEALVFETEPITRAHVALGRRAIRRALQRSGGLRRVGAGHIERILRLARSERRSGRRLPLPGGREAFFRFDELRIGEARESRPFDLPLEVPGRATLPDGDTIVAAPAPHPQSAGGQIVVSAPRLPLSVRSRRPGDRVRRGSREISLKRYLLQHHIPADRRAALPLVASGSRVLWVPGLPAENVIKAGETLVRLRIEPARSAAPKH